MTDYTGEGAVPADDAAVDDPPTIDEVLDEQRRRDDLPDPSDDPLHQQVSEDASQHTAEDGRSDDDAEGAEESDGQRDAAADGAGGRDRRDDEEDLSELLIDQAIANDSHPNI